MPESYYPHFFTATILGWKPLLTEDRYKDIITGSLDFLVRNKRTAVYGFVIMPNHMHLIWHIVDGHRRQDVQRDFLKYTAQRIKGVMGGKDLESFRVNAADRQYQIWERNPLSVELFSEKVLVQKLQYVHWNPVKAGLVEWPWQYRYSSALFYEGVNVNWAFLTHFAGYT